MGRTRSFDVETVVVRAARAFVSSGYEATSLDMLVTATGLHRGSLYGAFGSKRGLFIAALQLAEGEQLAPVERVDLVLVALLELAPSDRTVRELTEERMRALPRPAALHLGERLLQRAGISSPSTTREVTA